MTRYTAHVQPVGRLWHIEVPAVERVTQARSAREIATMAADLIEAMTDGPVRADEIDVIYELPSDVQQHIERAQTARAEEERARRTANQEQKAAAQMLSSLGFSRRDTGAVLGISHQRVQQLIRVS